jgi:hypothetical protein
MADHLSAVAADMSRAFPRSKRLVVVEKTVSILGTRRKGI